MFDKRYYGAILGLVCIIIQATNIPFNQDGIYYIVSICAMAISCGLSIRYDDLNIKGMTLLGIMGLYVDGINIYMSTTHIQSYILSVIINTCFLFKVGRHISDYACEDEPTINMHVLMPNR
jgi:hypothetical protein